MIEIGIMIGEIDREVVVIMTSMTEIVVIVTQVHVGDRDREVRDIREDIKI